MIGDNKKVEFTLDELDEISCVLGLEIFKEKEILYRLKCFLDNEAICSSNTYLEVSSKVKMLENIYSKLLELRTILIIVLIILILCNLPLF